MILLCVSVLLIAANQIILIRRIGKLEKAYIVLLEKCFALHSEHATAHRIIAINMNRLREGINYLAKL